MPSSYRNSDEEIGSFMSLSRRERNTIQNQNAKKKMYSLMSKGNNFQTQFQTMEDITNYSRIIIYRETSVEIMVIIYLLYKI